jgi:hypothetical protein
MPFSNCECRENRRTEKRAVTEGRSKWFCVHSVHSVHIGFRAVTEGRSKWFCVHTVHSLHIGFRAVWSAA